MKRIFAKISFMKTEEGGRAEPIPMMNFGCPVLFFDPPLLAHGYDCRLLMLEYGRVPPLGVISECVPMVFLSENDVVPHLKIGTKFTLWEGKTIAVGEVQDFE